MEMTQKEIRWAQAVHHRRLTQLREIYPESHPLIQIHVRQVAALEAKLQGARKKMPPSEGL